MFDKDGVRDVTETIVYANLLIAILALILLYDRRRIENEDQAARDQELHDITAALEKRIALLEEQLAGAALELRRLREGE